MNRLAIRNARVVDPVAGTLVEGGVLIEDGLLAAVGDVDDGLFRRSDAVADARGALVLPGLVDACAFAVDPAAAAAGGITTTLLMPDHAPPLDQPALIREIAAGRESLRVHPIAAATRGLAGQEMAELGLMKRAGAVAVATGRGWIADSGLMHRLLAYAAALDLVVVSHAEDAGLVRHAVATDGETATRLGLASAPAIAEAMAVARDLMLAEETGARLHFRQLSTAAALDLVRAAKRRGVRVTCGITPAHLLLSDTAIGPFRTFARLSPPLRSESDRAACLAAVADGTIDLLCSGHDPRGPEAKRLPYANAEPGMAGAATLLALALTLVRDGVIDLPRLAALLTAAPARLFGLASGTLAVGAPADVILVDDAAPWRIAAETLPGKAGNTPFDALPVQGRVLKTIKGGQPLG
ncbi:dihydroorotase [Sphingomonas morindae]|uniref:Amidohydrolase family protein n=1 Tax=Sphingomonas morindae TaxID=1541170 RepID=A0ABY4X8L3_9SPHN|nr:amidohydrolase family protein [Sphingomonas morindae]USI73219.1 amidohydrolase family protein [Sphingomonas morindae]